MKKVLLTGGSGFIGRNLLESELAGSYDIVAPTRLELDLQDEDAVRAYIRRVQPDAIIHAAAKPAHRNAKDPTGAFFTNTRNFFNIARNQDYFGKLIITGSGAVYDLRNYQPKMSEDYFDTHVPLDEHGMCKYTIEQYIKSAKNIYDLRIFGIYGKYEDLYIRFISNMICKALFNLPLSMKQDRYFDYIWVGDLVPVLAYVIENGLPWHSMNVTPDKSINLLAIAQMVLQMTGKKLPITVEHEGLGLEYSGSNKRLRSVLPNIIQTPLRDGIKQLVAWYTTIKDSVDYKQLIVNK